MAAPQSPEERARRDRQVVHAADRLDLAGRLGRGGARRWPVDRSIVTRASSSSRSYSDARERAPNVWQLSAGYRLRIAERASQVVLLDFVGDE